MLILLLGPVIPRVLPFCVVFICFPLYFQSKNTFPLFLKKKEEENWRESEWNPFYIVIGPSSQWLGDPLCDWTILSVIGPSSLWLGDPLCDWTILSVIGPSSLWLDHPLCDWTFLSVIGQSSVICLSNYSLIGVCPVGRDEVMWGCILCFGPSCIGLEQSCEVFFRLWIKASLWFKVEPVN